jgi:hypothetical protein
MDYTSVPGAKPSSNCMAILHGLDAQMAAEFFHNGRMHPVVYPTARNAGPSYARMWFGELLPIGELEAAIRAARTCAVFFSIGTSGIVQPAATLPFLAKQGGAVLVEINTEETPLTQSADYFFQGKSGEILPELVKQVWEER